MRFYTHVFAEDAGDGGQELSESIVVEDHGC